MTMVCCCVYVVLDDYGLLFQKVCSFPLWRLATQLMKMQVSNMYVWN